MAIPTIDQLPDAPNPSDEPAVFDADAFPLVAALNPMVEQINAALAWMGEPDVGYTLRAPELLDPLPNAAGRAGGNLGFDAFGQPNVFTDNLIAQKVALATNAEKPSANLIVLNGIDADEYSVRAALNVEDGATANATNAELRDRATHTGTQAISTVTGLQSAIDSKLDKASDRLALAASSPSVGDVSTTKGCDAPGDGGHGTFDVVASTSLPVDGYSVIEHPNGAFSVLRAESGAVNTRQFGNSFQLALDYCGQNLGLNLDVYSLTITTPCFYRPQRALSPSSNLHFGDNLQVHIRGIGNCIIAVSSGAAPMNAMLTLQYNTLFSAHAPFHTVIDNIEFNLGGGIAEVAVVSDFCMHVSYRKFRSYNGDANSWSLRYIGYGVADIRDCVLGTTNGIDFDEGGGDSTIEHVDFFPGAGGTCIRLAKFSGNTSINKCVFNGEGNAGILGVNLDGEATTEDIRDVRIFDNEFSGMDTCIKGRKNADTRNINRLSIYENHIIPAAGGAVHTGKFVDLIGADDTRIHNNYVNGKKLLVTTSNLPAIQLSDCRRSRLHDNDYGNLRGGALKLTSCIDSIVHHEKIVDVGQIGASDVICDISGTSTNNKFQNIDIIQTSASYAQNSIYERAGSSLNTAESCSIVGASAPFFVGNGSYVGRRVVAAVAFSATGTTVTEFANSYGATVVANSTGNYTVTLDTSRATSAYSINVVSDGQYVVDSRNSNSFRVLLFDVGTNTSTDTLYTSLEIMA